MFNSDDWDDDFFKGHTHWDSQWQAGGGGAMDVVIGLACVVGVAVLLALLYRCCRSTKYRGRVLRPAPDPNSSVPAPPGTAPYPQQQYSTVTVTAVPVGAPYAGAGAPYPGAGAPYPSAAAPYPGAGAPYPGAAAPYPAVAPYPPGAYPAAMPQPSAAPSAPDAHAFIGIAPPAPPGWSAPAMPPSYDQVMSNEAKHPAFNPYAPH